MPGFRTSGNRAHLQQEDFEVEMQDASTLANDRRERPRPREPLSVEADGQSAFCFSLARSICPGVACPKAMIWCVSFLGILTAWTALTVAIVHYIVENSIGQCRPDTPWTPHEVYDLTLRGGKEFSPTKKTTVATSQATEAIEPLDIKFLARLEAPQLKQVKALNLRSGAWKASVTPVAVTRTVWGLNPVMTGNNFEGSTNFPITLEAPEREDSPESFHPRIPFLGEATQQNQGKHSNARLAIDGRTESCTKVDRWWQVNLGQHGSRGPWGYRLHKLRLVGLQPLIEVTVLCSFGQKSQICKKFTAPWKNPRGHVLSCECSAKSLKIEASGQFNLCEVEIYIKTTQPYPEAIDLTGRLQRSVCDPTRSCQEQDVKLPQKFKTNRNGQTAVRVAFGKVSLRMVRLLFNGPAPAMTLYAERHHADGIPCARTSPSQLANKGWIEVLCNPRDHVDTLLIQMWSEGTLEDLKVYGFAKGTQICKRENSPGEYDHVWCDPHPLLLDGTREHLLDYKTIISVSAADKLICAELKSGLGWTKPLKFQCRKFVLAKTSGEQQDSMKYLPFLLRPVDSMESCAEHHMQKGFVSCDSSAASKKIRPLDDVSYDVEYGDVRVEVEGFGNYRICASVLGEREPGQISIVCSESTIEQTDKILHSVALVTDLGRLVISPQSMPEFHQDSGNFGMCGNFLTDPEQPKPIKEDNETQAFLMQFFHPSIMSLYIAMCGEVPFPFEVILSNSCRGSHESEDEAVEPVQVQLDLSDGFLNSQKQMVSSNEFHESLKAVGFVPTHMMLSVQSGRFKVCDLKLRAAILSSMDQDVTWEAALRNPFKDPLPQTFLAGQSLEAPLTQGVGVALIVKGNEKSRSSRCILQGKMDHLATMFPDEAISQKSCSVDSCSFKVEANLSWPQLGLAYASTASFPVPSLPQIIRCEEARPSFHGWLRLERNVLKVKSSGISCVPSLVLPREPELYECSGTFNGHPYWTSPSASIAWRRMKERRPGWVKTTFTDPDQAASSKLFEDGSRRMPPFEVPLAETFSGAMLVESCVPGTFVSSLHAHLFIVRIFFYDNSLPTTMKLSDVKVYAQLKAMAWSDRIQCEGKFQFSGNFMTCPLVVADNAYLPKFLRISVLGGAKSLKARSISIMHGKETYVLQSSPNMSAAIHLPSEQLAPTGFLMPIYIVKAVFDFNEKVNLPAVSNYRAVFRSPSIATTVQFLGHFSPRRLVAFGILPDWPSEVSIVASGGLSGSDSFTWQKAWVEMLGMEIPLSTKSNAGSTAGSTSSISGGQVGIGSGLASQMALKVPLLHKFEVRLQVWDRQLGRKSLEVAVSLGSDMSFKRKATFHWEEGFAMAVLFVPEFPQQLTIGLSPAAHEYEQVVIRSVQTIVNGAESTLITVFQNLLRSQAALVTKKQPWALPLSYYYFQLPHTEGSCSNISPSCQGLKISDKQCDRALQTLGYNPGDVLLFEKSSPLFDGNLDTFQVFALDDPSPQSWDIDQKLIDFSQKTEFNIMLRLHPGPEDGCFEAFYGLAKPIEQNARRMGYCKNSKIEIRATLGDKDCTFKESVEPGVLTYEPFTFACKLTKASSTGHKLQLSFPRLPGQKLSLAEVELRPESNEVLLEKRPALPCRSAFQEDLRICACRPHILQFSAVACAQPECALNTGHLMLTYYLESDDGKSTKPLSMQLACAQPVHPGSSISHTFVSPADPVGLKLELQAVGQLDGVRLGLQRAALALGNVVTPFEFLTRGALWVGASPEAQPYLEVFARFYTLSMKLEKPLENLKIVAAWLVDDTWTTDMLMAEPPAEDFISVRFRLRFAPTSLRLGLVPLRSLGVLGITGAQVEEFQKKQKCLIKASKMSVASDAFSRQLGSGCIAQRPLVIQLSPVYMTATCNAQDPQNCRPKGTWAPLTTCKELSEVRTQLPSLHSQNCLYGESADCERLCQELGADCVGVHAAETNENKPVCFLLPRTGSDKFLPIPNDKEFISSRVRFKGCSSLSKQYLQLAEQGPVVAWAPARDMATGRAESLPCHTLHKDFHGVLSVKCFGGQLEVVLSDCKRTECLPVGSVEEAEKCRSGAGYRLPSAPNVCAPPQKVEAGKMVKLTCEEPFLPGGDEMQQTCWCYPPIDGKLSTCIFEKGATLCKRNFPKHDLRSAIFELAPYAIRTEDLSSLRAKANLTLKHLPFRAWNEVPGGIKRGIEVNLEIRDQGLNLSISAKPLGFSLHLGKNSFTVRKLQINLESTSNILEIWRMDADLTGSLSVVAELDHAEIVPGFIPILKPLLPMFTQKNGERLWSSRLFTHKDAHEDEYDKWVHSELKTLSTDLQNVKIGGVLPKMEKLEVNLQVDELRACHFNHGPAIEPEGDGCALVSGLQQKMTVSTNYILCDQRMQNNFSIEGVASSTDLWPDLNDNVVRCMAWDLKRHVNDLAWQADLNERALEIALAEVASILDWGQQGRGSRRVSGPRLLSDDALDLAAAVLNVKDIGSMPTADISLRMDNLPGTNTMETELTLLAEHTSGWEPRQDLQDILKELPVAVLQGGFGTLKMQVEADLAASDSTTPLSVQATADLPGQTQLMLQAKTAGEVTLSIRGNEPISVTGNIFQKSKFLKMALEKPAAVNEFLNRASRNVVSKISDFLPTVQKWEIQCKAGGSLRCKAYVTLDTLKWCSAEPTDFKFSLSSSGNFNEAARKVLDESDEVLLFVQACFQQSLEAWQVNLPMFGMWLAVNDETEKSFNFDIPRVSFKKFEGRSLDSHDHRAIYLKVSMDLDGFRVDDADMMFDSRRLLVEFVLKMPLLPEVAVQVDAVYSLDWGAAWAGQPVTLGKLQLLGEWIHGHEVKQRHGRFLRSDNQGTLADKGWLASRITDMLQESLIDWLDEESKFRPRRLDEFGTYGNEHLRLDVVKASLFPQNKMEEMNIIPELQTITVSGSVIEGGRWDYCAVAISYRLCNKRKDLKDDVANLLSANGDLKNENHPLHPIWTEMFECAKQSIRELAGQWVVDVWQYLVTEVSRSPLHFLGLTLTSPADENLRPVIVLDSSDSGFEFLAAVRVKADALGVLPVLNGVAFDLSIADQRLKLQGSIDLTRNIENFPMPMRGMPRPALAIEITTNYQNGAFWKSTDLGIRISCELPPQFFQALGQELVDLARESIRKKDPENPLSESVAVRRLRRLNAVDFQVFGIEHLYPGLFFSVEITADEYGWSASARMTVESCGEVTTIELPTGENVFHAGQLKVEDVVDWFELFWRNTYKQTKKVAEKVAAGMLIDLFGKLFGQKPGAKNSEMVKPTKLSNSLEIGSRKMPTGVTNKVSGNVAIEFDEYCSPSLQANVTVKIKNILTIEEAILDANEDQVSIRGNGISVPALNTLSLHDIHWDVAVQFPTAMVFGSKLKMGEGGKIEMPNPIVHSSYLLVELSISNIQQLTEALTKQLKQMGLIEHLLELGKRLLPDKAEFIEHILDLKITDLKVTMKVHAGSNIEAELYLNGLWAEVPLLVQTVVNPRDIVRFNINAIMPRIVPQIKEYLWTKGLPLLLRAVCNYLKDQSFSLHGMLNFTVTEAKTAGHSLSLTADMQSLIPFPLEVNKVNLVIPFHHGQMITLGGSISLPRSMKVSFEGQLPFSAIAGADMEDDKFLFISIVAKEFGTITDDIERHLKAFGLLGPLQRLAQMFNIANVWDLVPVLRSLSLTVHVPLNGGKVRSEQELVLEMFGRSISASTALDRYSLKHMSVGKERRLLSATAHDLEDQVGGIFKIRSLLESLREELLKRARDPSFWCETAAFLMGKGKKRVTGGTISLGPLDISATLEIPSQQRRLRNLRRLATLAGEHQDASNYMARRLQESLFHSQADELERRLATANKGDICLQAEIKMTAFSSLFDGMPKMAITLTVSKHEIAGTLTAFIFGSAGPAATVTLSLPTEILLDPHSPKLKERVLHIHASLSNFQMINGILRAFPGVFLKKGQQPALHYVNLTVDAAPALLTGSGAGVPAQATLSVQMSICADNVTLELPTTMPHGAKGWLDIAMKLGSAIMPNIMRCLFPEKEKSTQLRRLDEETILQSAVMLSDAGVEPEDMEQLVWDPDLDDPAAKQDRRLAGGAVQTFSQTLVKSSQMFLVFFKEVNDPNGKVQRFLQSIGLKGVQFRPLIKPDPSLGLEVYIEDADLLEVGGEVGKAMKEFFQIFRVRASGWIAVGIGNAKAFAGLEVEVKLCLGKLLGRTDRGVGLDDCVHLKGSISINVGTAGLSFKAELQIIEPKSLLPFPWSNKLMLTRVKPEKPITVGLGLDPAMFPTDLKFAFAVVLAERGGRAQDCPLPGTTDFSPCPTMQFDVDLKRMEPLNSKVFIRFNQEISASHLLAAVTGVDLDDYLSKVLDTAFPAAGPLLVDYRDGTVKAMGQMKGPLFDDFRMLAHIEFNMRPKALTMAFTANLVLKSFCFGIEYREYGCTGLLLDRVPHDSPARNVYREVAKVMNQEFGQNREVVNPVPFSEDEVGFVFGAHLSLTGGLKVSSELNTKLQILGVSILQAAYRLELRAGPSEILFAVYGELSILNGVFQVVISVAFSNLQFAAYFSLSCGNLGQLQELVAQKLKADSTKLLRDLATAFLKLLPKSISVKLNLMLGPSSCFHFMIALDWFDVEFALRLGDGRCEARRKAFGGYGKSLEAGGGGEEDCKEVAGGMENAGFWSMKVIKALVTDMVVVARAVAMLIVQAVKETVKAVANFFLGWFRRRKRRLSEATIFAIERKRTSIQGFQTEGHRRHFLVEGEGEDEVLGNESHIFLIEESSPRGSDLLELLNIADIDLAHDIIQRDGQIQHIEEELSAIWPRLWFNGRLTPQIWWASPSFHRVRTMTAEPPEPMPDL